MQTIPTAAHTCCFIGHRNINHTKELEELIYNTVEDLILCKNVSFFLFGSKSDFNSLCHRVVSELRQKYPHVTRIYVRAEFPYIAEDYRNYLLLHYEDTYYPEEILNAGKSVYIQRNYILIDKRLFCVVYYNKDYSPSTGRHSTQHSVPHSRKSGTKLAYDYAVNKKKTVINLFK